MKKSQSALEFLTTYGWAFLVILIMIGALAYFGVLNPQQLLPERCTVSPGFACTEYVLDSDGDIGAGFWTATEDTGFVMLRNNVGSVIVLEGITQCTDGNPSEGGLGSRDSNQATGPCRFVDRAGDSLDLTDPDDNEIQPGQEIIIRFDRPEDAWIEGNKEKAEFVFTFRRAGRAIGESASGEIYATVRE